MEARGVEPLSENLSPRISTSVFCYFGNARSLKAAQTDTRDRSVDRNTSKGHSLRPMTFTTNRRLYPSRGTQGQDER